MSFKLYQLTLPDGRQYIGVTKDARRRFTTHRKRFGDATICVLVVGDRDYIYNLEREAIRVFDTRQPKGLNVAAGGFGCRDPLPQTRKKIAAGQLGRHHSLERRAQWSKDRKGKKLPPQHCANIAAALRLRPQVIRRAAAQKRAKKLKGRKFSATHILNLSLSHRGKPWSVAQHAARRAYYMRVQNV